MGWGAIVLKISKFGWLRYKFMTVVRYICVIINLYLVH